MAFHDQAADRMLPLLISPFRLNVYNVNGQERHGQTPPVGRPGRAPAYNHRFGYPDADRHLCLPFVKEDAP